MKPIIFFLSILISKLLNWYMSLFCSSIKPFKCKMLSMTDSFFNLNEFKLNKINKIIVKVQCTDQMRILFQESTFDLTSIKTPFIQIKNSSSLLALYWELLVDFFYLFECKFVYWTNAYNVQENLYSHQASVILICVTAQNVRDYVKLNYLNLNIPWNHNWFIKNLISLK